ncbi:Cro/CI family transcriptional regulator [Enterobacter ludwigii]|jgi:predicted transcriptional regulator
MLTTDAIEFFGTKTKLAEIAGVSQAAVSRWVKAGYIPQGAAADLAVVTCGSLKFNREFYQTKKTESLAKRKAKRERKLKHENHSDG